MTERAPQHGERIKAALLAAAADLFIRVGYQATTVRDIAAQAEVTTGSLYHFFANKEALLAHLVKDVFATTEAMADAAAADPFLCLSFELALQIELFSDDARLATLYEAAHASHAISRQIVQLAQRRFGHLLAGRVQHLPLAEVAGTLAITAKSLMMGLVQERVMLNQLTRGARQRLLLTGLWSQVPELEVDVPALLGRLDGVMAGNRRAIRALRPAVAGQRGANQPSAF